MSQKTPIEEAKEMVERYEQKSILSPDEEFTMIEAFHYVIEETKDSRWMVGLGGYYYAKKEFDLALKYYEMADSFGDPWAPEGLGYIWYYGRTGEKDYEKAFHYYSKAADNGILRSRMKIADMYRNGYYVEKDCGKYCELIEELAELVDQGYGWDEKNDVYIRLAKIRKEQGRIDEAVELMEDARAYLAGKIECNPFFGDLNVMRWLIGDLYEMTEIDRSDLDLFDLYHLLKAPCKVRFLYNGESYEVEAIEDGESLSVRFGDKWYRSADDFFKKADIDGERIPALYSMLYGFEVM